LLAAVDEKHSVAGRGHLEHFVNSAATAIFLPNVFDAPSAAKRFGLAEHIVVNPFLWKKLDIGSKPAKAEAVFSSTKSQKLAHG
jgi:hypothetical protein